MDGRRIDKVLINRVSTRPRRRRLTGGGDGSFQPEPGVRAPPRFAIQLHCSSDTGITDRRGRRTSAKSAKSFTALTSASVTGCLSGEPGTNSTA